MYRTFDFFLTQIHLEKKIRVAVACGQDSHVIEAIKMAMKHDLVEPIFVGDEKKINVLLEEAGLTENVQIVNETDISLAAEKAVLLVRDKKADVLMKGLVNTAVFLRTVLKSENGLKTDRMLGHLAAFEVPSQKKVFFLTDMAFNIAPDLEGKKGLLMNAITAIRSIGIDKPKVALLSANDVPNPKIPASVDAVELVKLNKEGFFPPCIMEGPMALDVIANHDACDHKGIVSEVSGDTDLILVPDIESGNGISKAFSNYAGGTMAGVILGAKVPIVLNSRSDSARGKFFSLILALLLQSKS